MMMMIPEVNATPYYTNVRPVTHWLSLTTVFLVDVLSNIVDKQLCIWLKASVEESWLIQIRMCFNIEFYITHVANMELYKWITKTERGELWGDNRCFGILLEEPMVARCCLLAARMGSSTDRWMTYMHPGLSPQKLNFCQCAKQPREWSRHML
jgi:hypothetical protein